MQNVPTTALELARATVQSAIDAGRAAALAQWEKDGRQDCGHCGGTMLQLDSRSFIAKAALELKAAYKSGSETWAALDLPEGVRTQHAIVYQKQKHAFADSLRRQGFGGVIRKMWDYVD